MPEENTLQELARKLIETYLRRESVKASRFSGLIVRFGPRPQPALASRLPPVLVDGKSVGREANRAGCWYDEPPEDELVGCPDRGKNGVGRWAAACQQTLGKRRIRGTSAQPFLATASLPPN